jgi:hypothetical protein
MLSKAEILYLQGQKQVSKSYERKLKCLIRKKIEVFGKEFPLLSSLSTENTKSVLFEIVNEKAGRPNFSFKKPNWPRSSMLQENHITLNWKVMLSQILNL